MPSGETREMVGTRLSEQTLDRLEELQERPEISSRSDAVRRALAAGLDHEIGDESGSGGTDREAGTEADDRRAWLANTSTAGAGAFASGGIVAVLVGELLAGALLIGAGVVGLVVAIAIVAGWSP